VDITAAIIIKVKSYRPWPAEIWDRLFPHLEELVGTTLTHLDDRDPMRRKVDGGKGQGSYTGAFRGKAASSYAAGKFGKSGIWFMLDHRRWPSRIENSMSLFIPAKAAKKIGLAGIEGIFNVLLAELRPFYQVCDVEDIVNSRKPSPPCAIVHHSYELSGVYWLTYFGPKYRAFFGDYRFRALPHEWTEGDGVKLKLGDNPWWLEDEKRRAAEKALGELTFASYGENKKEYEHVIPWPELLEGDSIAEYQRREAAGIKPWEFG
jgi:hypothetical protein